MNKNYITLNYSTQLNLLVIDFMLLPVWNIWFGIDSSQIFIIHAFQFLLD